tara:strand:+ start:435 stop:845 length:411 start_codon:yes stop_codon:yes gene_type:complete
MANIQMPIEIKADNTILPLQQFSNVHVVSIISSINDIQVDRSLPDIITQSNAMFAKQNISTPVPVPVPVPVPEPEQEDSSCDEPEPTIEPPVVHVPQLWIRPDELRKTPLPFKKNSSFKNHSNYKHRTTAKKRESC